ncbi:hypothetical protein BVC80_1503g6 [Macleaya cordata]|uniref:Uncharacterized protein n=1 Tax=Macleaya cordata TaxID=56857 RepID=A0A200PM58_MACCD|nr:hypothetical protein BVC80_1503g6 [Macleaya cordata]
MEIDEEKENPSEINSKKRKLQDEQSDLPSPKHKFREKRSAGSKQESPFPEDVGLEVKPLNSAEDSNSFVGENNSAISLYPADMFEPEFPKTYAYDQPSTSSCSCSDNSLKETLSTLNRKTKISTTDDRKHDAMNLTGALQFDSGPQNTELQLCEFEKYDDSICSGCTNDEIKECQDVGSNDLMLSWNGSNPNSYVLSSGRWSIKQNTRLGARKPTIDQEFEKYFSMLML